MDIPTAKSEYKRLSPLIFKQTCMSPISNLFRAMFGMSWFRGDVLEKNVKMITEDRVCLADRESLHGPHSEANLILDHTHQGSGKA
jgi:hypothetical protein